MTTAEFQANIKACCESVSTNELRPNIIGEYVDARNRVTQTCRDLGITKEGMKAAYGKLAVSATRKWLLHRFPLINLSFTKHVQNVYVTFDEKDNPGKLMIGTCVTPQSGAVAYGKMPVFWRSQLNNLAAFMDNNEDQYRLQKVDVYLSDLPRILRKRSHAKQVYLSATPPNGLTDLHRGRICDLASELYLLQSECVAHGVDVLNELPQRSIHHHHSDWCNILGGGACSVIWAPLITDITINTKPEPPKGDPAVVMSVADDIHVLVDFYDAPNEGPIESIVREFSDGKLD